jgi:hypothetical protein
MSGKLINNYLHPLAGMERAAFQATKSVNSAASSFRTYLITRRNVQKWVDHDKLIQKVTHLSLH